jgi:hypothetical protein
MRGVLGAALALLAVAAVAQEATDYTTAENPYQAEYAFTPGQPIVMRVDVQGVMLDSITITPPATLPPSGAVACDVQVAGSNETGKKITLTTVVLLEDASSQALERLTLAPVRVKARRPINAREAVEVQSASLAAAARVYLFIKVD